MRYISKLALLIFVIVCSMGFTDNNVRKVQRSTLSQNSTKTVKDTLELIFTDSDWRSVKDKGELKVYYSGKVSKKMRADLVKQIKNRGLRGIYYDDYVSLRKEFDKQMKPYQDKRDAYEARVGEFRTAQNKCSEVKCVIDRLDKKWCGFLPDTDEEAAVYERLSRSELENLRDEICDLSKYDDINESARSALENEYQKRWDIIERNILDNYLNRTFSVSSHVYIEWVIMPNSGESKMKSFRCEHLKGDACDLVFMYFLMS